MNKNYDKYSNGRVTYSANGCYKPYKSDWKKVRRVNIYLIDVILFTSLIVGLLIAVARFVS